MIYSGNCFRPDVFQPFELGTSEVPLLLLLFRPAHTLPQDFPPVKFIIDSFQENYPESLGAMIFYNAPWIFSGLSQSLRPLSVRSATDNFSPLV